MTPTTHTPRRRALTRAILGAALPLALLIVAAALAVSGGGDSQTASTSVSLRATGPVTITNNHEGSAIFTATGKRPGQSQQGTVTIKNTGGDASYVLSESAATNSPGLNGG